MAPCCAHTPYAYFDFNLKSLAHLAQKLAEKLLFFIKFMYVTIVTFRVTTGHRSRNEMKGCI